MFTRARYTKDGDLLPPEGYRTWVFVGADLGLDYSERNDQSLDDPKKKDENDDRSRPFHNVYIDPVASISTLRPASFRTRRRSCSSFSNRVARSRGIT